jgi:hypothetical protein
MKSALDARVPVVLAPAEEAGPDDALLLETDGTAPHIAAAVAFQVESAHPQGCACCSPRRGAGRALAALLHARARGETAYFRRVIAVPVTAAGRADILAALRSDPVAAACFRLVQAD